VAPDEPGGGASCTWGAWGLLLSLQNPLWLYGRKQGVTVTKEQRFGDSPHPSLLPESFMLHLGQKQDISLI
jgi:hypothetical protein